MQESPQPRINLIKLGKLANSQKFDELEDVWLAAIEDKELASEDLIPIAGQVGRLGALAKAESLLWVLLSSLDERAGPEAALAAARLVMKELPEAVGLRPEIARLYQAAYPDLLGLKDLFDRVFTEDRPGDQAMVLLDAYLSLSPGAFITDRNYLEPGVVERRSPQTAEVVARFGRRHQEYDLETVGELSTLPGDHFPALRLYEPERLRELVTQEPVTFVLLALKYGKDDQIAYRDLKADVTRLLGEAGWTAWWKTAKSQLKRSPRIELSSGSQPIIRLLREQSSYEQRLREVFDAAGGPLARLELISTYLHEVKSGRSRPDAADREDASPERDLLAYFGNSAAQMAVAALTEHPVVAMACLAVHAAVAVRGVAVATPNPRAAAKVLDRVEDPALLAQDLPESLLLLTLDYLREVLPDRWPRIWSATLSRAGRRLCDVVVRGLVEAGQLAELEAALAKAVQKPTTYPEVLGWLWRNRQTGSLSPTLKSMASLTDVEILTSLLNLGDAAGRVLAISGDDRQRKITEMVQQTLMQQKGAAPRAVFAAADSEAAGKLKLLIEQNAGLTSLNRGRLLGLLRLEHERLFAEDSRPWRDEGVIYTTETGLLRRQEDLERIIKFDIPAVAKQIGEAAAFGDLSENSEYTAALEKRDQLTSRAAMMENEIKAARIITPDMARSPYVNVGCRIRARNLDSDREETFCFLGPWDAEPERGVLTYDAPLALAFMGHKVGDEVVYGEGDDRRRWEVMAIEPGL